MISAKSFNSQLSFQLGMGFAPGAVTFFYPVLVKFHQPMAQIVDGELTLEMPSPGKREHPGFFRDDDDPSIGKFGKPYGGAVASTQDLREIGIVR